jgi:hypothetical protein
MLGYQPIVRDLGGSEIPTNAAFCSLQRTSKEAVGRGSGGASRDRTDDLFHAMEALSQLSYSPVRKTLFSKGFRYLPPKLRGDPDVSEGRENTCKSVAWKAIAAHAWGAYFSAASMRASVRSRPSNASVASIGGEIADPATATRNGWAILPSPVCSSFARSFTEV